jgi:sugar/nucleoside kinase (ribokinase family)
MKKIVVAGEILVEIMADTVGDGFREPVALTGPYPSGAPAIFIDQVARMGLPCGIISMVGNDDFGRLNIDRLAADGVDVSAIGVDPDRPTGSAFVRYRPDGLRDFVFNIRHSACGMLPRGRAVDALLAGADHLHVMGTSLSSPEIIGFNIGAARGIRAKGGTVSFDPNMRKEILDAPGVADAMEAILDITDLFLPSGEEITLLTRARDEAGAVSELLARGIRAIVHKKGVEGACHHDATGSRSVPAFRVTEVDPTGAGDCFGGAFVAMWLQGADIHRALTISAAAGALAVTRRGPMEGAATFDAIRTFAAAQGRPA